MTRRWAGPWSAVAGTPRWAIVCAWLPLLCVLPSSIWRTAVGFGVPLGWSPTHLSLERIPGYGTLYVLELSVASLAAAGLSLGLIYQWGERVPGWVPGLAGRQIAAWLVAALAVAGAIAVAAIVGLSIAHWSQVSGFGDRPTSGWALLMAACYAPAVLWPPLLLAATLAYLRRRTRGHQ